MVRNICPGDPSDIKCCVRSPSELRQSGSRPAGSTVDSGDVHIPGIVHPNLPDTIMVPDSSIFDPQDQTKINEFFIQPIQSEIPFTENGASDPIFDEDSYFSYYPDEEFSALAENLNSEADLAMYSFGSELENVPASDPDLSILQSSDLSSDDAQLAANIFAEDRD